MCDWLVELLDDILYPPPPMDVRVTFTKKLARLARENRDRTQMQEVLGKDYQQYDIRPGKINRVDNCTARALRARGFHSLAVMATEDDSVNCVEFMADGG